MVARLVAAAAEVGADGTVMLIDCDSFQVRDGAEVFTCDVGVPLFTASELHGYGFRGLLRTENHDRFGLAVLLFHNDLPSAPGRLFTAAEWHTFRDAYLRHVTLTARERAAWPLALRYMYCDEAVWALVDGERWGDYDDARQRAFFLDLAGTDEHRFTLD